MHNLPETVAEAKQHNTPIEHGLSDDAVSKSRAQHGENRLPEAQQRSVWSMFLGALNDKTLLILIGAALLSIGVEVFQSQIRPDHVPHYIDGIAILGAVLIASLVTTLNEAKAAKQFRELSKVREDILAKVLRGGHVKQISIFELVVGDLVHFNSGDKLPADGALLRGVDVEVDQSTLTGESVPVAKGEEDRALRGGTTVTSGHGIMLVTAVGAKSEIGKLQLTLTETEEEPTPLQERLAVLADRIGYFGLGAAILTFLALSISAFSRGQLPLTLNLATGGQLLEFLIVAVTIVVVAVPEGLPLAVTISLAYSVSKMAKDNNLVRKLASCETMGAATVVCSDKTGTLTKNRMSLVAAHIDGRAFDQAPEKGALGDAAAMVESISAINATAFLEHDENGVVQYVGNPTECALLAAIEQWGVDWKKVREDAEVVHLFGFTSDRKRMSTLIAQDGGHTLLVKGAPEVLLGRAEARLSQGQTAPLDDAARAEVLSAVERFSSEGHRTLGLAYRRWDGALPEDQSAEALEQSLVFLGVVAIADPVRPEVKDAIVACREAGVSVKIVTGDNKLTARSIGAQIGLVDDDSVILEGEAFREMSDEELQPILPKLAVLARSVPTDKFRLVNLLKAQGEVVAVTGDGTNDAPALHTADVGFSMGLTGTEVAKEASDIVILDDNFASIVGGILWGRSIFENIRKFLQFQLTVNVVALSTAFLAAVFGFGIPLNTVQLLWVNLIMDTMAALALATEPPTEALFHQPPHGRHAPLITKAMWAHIFLMGALMIAVLLLSMWTDWLVPKGTPQTVKLTFVFNTFVLMQVFNEINARSTRFDRGVFKGFFDNQLFLGVIVVSLVAQWAIIQFGGVVFRTTPLSAQLWGWSMAIGASMLLVGMAVRALGRSLPKSWFGESVEAAA